jgi:uncharacterized protein YjbI with pentapeptide repeats
MSIHTATARKNYKDLEGSAAPAPLMNFALPAIQHKSSMRFGALQPAPSPTNAAKLQTIKLAGGGSIAIQNNSGTAAEAAKNAKAKLAEMGLKNRAPIIDIKNDKEDLRNQDLRGIVISGKGGADFSGADLSGSTMLNMGGGIKANNAKMTGMTIRDSRLDGSEMHGADLSNSNFIGENSAIGIKANNLKAHGTNFGGAHLTNATMTNMKCDNTNMTGSQMKGATISAVKGGPKMTPKMTYAQRANQLHANYMNGPSI